MSDHDPPPPHEPEPEPPQGEADAPLPDAGPEPDPIVERHPAPPPPEPPPPPPAPPSGYVLTPHPRRRRPRVNWLRRLIVWLLIIVFVLPPAWVLVYRFAPPPITPLMAIRLGQGQGLDYRWRSLDQMSPALVMAAVAAEDSGYCQHHGFDFRAMQKAMSHNEKKPGRVRGGSTISQQAAKNVFLWPDRSYVRKAIEAYFTVLIETLWGKRRIMEVYLNVVEMGPGTYGAEAASRLYFSKPASELSAMEASRLVAILPSPLKWRAVGPGRYVQRRTQRIGGAMGMVRIRDLAACVGTLSGRIPSGSIDLDAAPPKAAEAFVQQKQTEEQPASPADTPPQTPDQPADPIGEMLDGSSAPGSDADQKAPPASDAAPAAQ